MANGFVFFTARAAGHDTAIVVSSVRCQLFLSSAISDRQNYKGAQKIESITKGRVFEA